MFLGVRVLPLLAQVLLGIFFPSPFPLAYGCRSSPPPAGFADCTLAYLLFSIFFPPLSLGHFSSFFNGIAIFWSFSIQGLFLPFLPPLSSEDIDPFFYL